MNDVLDSTLLNWWRVYVCCI